MIFSSRSSDNCCDIFVFWCSTSLFHFMNQVHHPLETRKLSIFICCAFFFLVCKRIRFLVTASPLFLFSSTHLMTFFLSSGHWHFLPQSALSKSFGFWQYMHSSNNKLIVPTVHNLMIILKYSLIQNKSTLGIYHPNYLLNYVTWIVAVNFGSFWWFGTRYVTCSPKYKSRSIFWVHFDVQKIQLVHEYIW